MGKKSKKTGQSLGEEIFHLPAHPCVAQSKKVPAPIIDTHTHLVSTFDVYRKKYPQGKYESVHEFVRGFYASEEDTGASQSTKDASKPKHTVEAIIDVWCEAPVDSRWKELADSAEKPEDRQRLWGGIEYWFVMGVHPHEARLYTDEVEAEILAAMKHPRCIGWGEIGLDYHYMNSPAEVQKTVLRRQLRHAVALGKPLTIHTREADEDIESILIEELPREYKVHVHCFTDSAGLAQRLLSHFPNLCIGVTGVITYSTNLNTSAVIRQMVTNKPSDLRILIETDAPYMVPSNIYEALSLSGAAAKSPRLAFSHSGMIPWTADFIATVATLVDDAGDDSDVGPRLGLDANDVLEISRENARRVYGV